MSKADPTGAASWDQRVGLTDAGWRKVMMWAFIITDGLMFAGFLASYGFARLATPGWPNQDEIFKLPFIAAMTFVLISSSATMASAVGASRAGRVSEAARFVWMTAAGGAIFLSMQAYEWTHLLREGATLWDNPWGAGLFGAYFFLITGFHGTHVLTGVIVLLVTGLHLGGGKSSEGGVELAGLYWHFVDLVWVFIFTFFYLL